MSDAATPPAAAAEVVAEAIKEAAGPVETVVEAAVEAAATEGFLESLGINSQAQRLLRDLFCVGVLLLAAVAGAWRQRAAS